MKVSQWHGLWGALVRLNEGACALLSAGSAVLVERGGCTFTEKSRAVQAANASVMIVYNDDEGALLLCI